MRAEDSAPSTMAKASANANAPCREYESPDKLALHCPREARRSDLQPPSPRHTRCPSPHPQQLHATATLQQVQVELAWGAGHAAQPRIKQQQQQHSRRAEAAPAPTSTSVQAVSWRLAAQTPVPYATYGAAVALVGQLQTPLHANAFLQMQSTAPLVSFYAEDDDDLSVLAQLCELACRVEQTVAGSRRLASAGKTGEPVGGKSCDAHSMHAELLYAEGEQEGEEEDEEEGTVLPSSWAAQTSIAAEPTAAVRRCSCAAGQSGRSGSRDRCLFGCPGAAVV